ncbi:tyrosine-type recombinase/integrase [Oliverpabstia intestinalis]|uniref:tyrosine-type recombinase/integrase n=1 Tax=Oliverpabstia intestinalis TaxID=2606633 RepID=UPI003F9E7CD7
MTEARKDARGRKLRTGEYFDSENQRYVFRKMVNGERINITASDLMDLRKQENELLCGIDRGIRFNTKKAKLTLNEYFDYWLKNFAKSGRKATTCTNYNSYYNTYIRGTIGKKQLNKVTKLDCQKIINQLQTNGKSHSTMSNLKSCLNIVFESALDEDIIFKNPVKNILLPQTETKKRTAMDPEQIEIFMNYIKNGRRYAWVYPEFVFLFNTGVRIGEMAALTWDNVDFENNTITIDKTVNRYRKKEYGFTVAMASPKSRTSVRKFPMNTEIRLILLKLKMKNMRPAAKIPFVDDAGNIRKYRKDLVFLNSAGNIWTEPTFLCLIKRIIDRYNREEAAEGEMLDDFCPHMARHTYTTLAYSAGADVKMVSEMLGHASTAVTMDTYTHITEEKRQEQEKIMEKIKVL